MAKNQCTQIIGRRFQIGLFVKYASTYLWQHSGCPHSYVHDVHNTNKHVWRVLQLFTWWLNSHTNVCILFILICQAQTKAFLYWYIVFFSDFLTDLDIKKREYCLCNNAKSIKVTMELCQTVFQTVLNATSFFWWHHQRRITIIFNSNFIKNLKLGHVLPSSIIYSLWGYLVNISAMSGTLLWKHWPQ